jgi:erythromycin esterase-like protein
MVTHGQVNLGGLAREKYGEDQIALVGFTTFTGKVIASDAWDGAIQIMSIPEAIEGSLEFALHEAIPKLEVENFYLDFTSLRSSSGFHTVMGHRAIGVVYHPAHEHGGNYVPTIPAKRYDALVFFNETRPLTPLEVKYRKDKIPESYPFGDQI